MCVCTLSRVHSIVYPLHGLQQYPYFLSPNTVDYISSHTATSFNTSDRGFPLHFPALILFCLLHWATLSLLSTTCWVSSSATKKMHIYILHHSSTKILTLQSHTRAQWTNREDPFSRTLHVQHPECARQPRKMGAAELKNSRVLQI